MNRLRHRQPKSGYTLHCEICIQPIGLFDIDIRVPFTKDMFKSLDPVHGVPEPFIGAIGKWRDWVCPLCHGLPFWPIKDDEPVKEPYRLRIGAGDNDFIYLEEPKPVNSNRGDFKCEFCDFKTTWRPALKSHIKAKHKEGVSPE